LRESLRDLNIFKGERVRGGKRGQGMRERMRDKKRERDSERISNKVTKEISARDKKKGEREGGVGQYQERVKGRETWRMRERHSEG